MHTDRRQNPCFHLNLRPLTWKFQAQNDTHNSCRWVRFANSGGRIPVILRRFNWLYQQQQKKHTNFSLHDALSDLRVKCEVTKIKSKSLHYYDMANSAIIEWTITFYIAVNLFIIRNCHVKIPLPRTRGSVHIPISVHRVKPPFLWNNFHAIPER